MQIVTMDRLYVITTAWRVDPTMALYWSNEDGWVNLASATIFSASEHRTCGDRH